MNKKILAAALFAGLAAVSSVNAGPWEVLFDGEKVQGLRGYMKKDFPWDGWKVEDGVLKTIVGGTTIDLVTDKKYRNYEFEVEWAVTPAGNSGIIYNVIEGPSATYFSGPEMQILDDKRHFDGRNPKTSAGSLYALIAPSEDKTLKPVGEFNKAVLRIKDGHVEHWLNGSKVVEYQWRSDKILELLKESKFNAWEKTFMQYDTGHIAIQHHGEEVHFRNIRIRSLDDAEDSQVSMNSLTPEEKEQGWELLFDGESMDHFRGFLKDGMPEKGWVIRDGCIVHEAGGGGGDIITRDRFEEFEFMWEWKVAPGANSGVKYFILEERKRTIGHEYQVIDDGKHLDALRGGKYKTASFYDVFPPQSKNLKPVGEFNVSLIRVKGQVAQHWLNGQKVLEYRLGHPDTLAAIANSKFRNVDGFGYRHNGHILLQDHGDEVHYRNLKIRRLD
jgi:hypothetical protein